MSKSFLLRTTIAFAFLYAGVAPLLAQKEKPCAIEETRADCPGGLNNALIQSDEPDPKPTQPSTPSSSPPDEQLEFAAYVERSLGYRLPLYGHNLFANAPSTFAPVSDIPVPADYVIGPGDELIVRGWGQVEIEARATVDRSGQVFLPKVGMISVAGVHYADLRTHLESSIQRVFRNFELNVSLGQLRSIQILVVGQARQPGSYTVSSLSTLVNALFSCGGPSVRGSMRRIELRRENRTVTTIDLYDLLLKGDKSHDVALLPGDVVYIPPVGPMVAMAGSVNVPAIYEVRAGVSLKQGIEIAGGLATTADSQKVSVERIEEHHLRRVGEFALDETGQQSLLRDGDIVRLTAVSPAIENAVTLRGNVAHPGRYPWRASMRINDLIPSREFLLTRDYWETKNGLVRDEAAAQPEEQADKKSKLTERDKPTATKHGKNQEELASEIKLNAPDINWGYAVIQRTNALDLTSELLPFNLAKAIESDDTSDLALQPGDVVTIFSARDIQVANAKRTKLVRMEGEFNAPGVYRCLPGETLRQLVARSGLNGDSYLYGAQFTRESTRAQQQEGLDRMIAEMEGHLEQIHSDRANSDSNERQQVNDARRAVIERLRALHPTGRIVLSLRPEDRDLRQIPEFVLEDGDRFIVPHEPATVNVAGEVFNQGSFLFNPTLRLRDYLRNAGGSTRNSDTSRMFVLRADGSVISRHSSKMWRGSFEGLRLYPGDTIIVPARLDRGATWRAVRDWSQVISQFALGAAAVKVLQ